MHDRNANPIRKRIVIIGGGFAGAYCAQALEPRMAALNIDVLLLDRNNYLLFLPLLIEAGTGSLEPRHVVVAIRSFVKRAEFRMANVISIDIPNSIVRYQVVGLEDGPPIPIEEVQYDHLVFAPGSVTLLPPVPGLLDFAFEMKDLSDAVGMRDRCIRLLEMADATADPEERRALLRLVVVGGNFSGSEVAGEFHEFLRESSRLYPNINRLDCNVTLVERDARILKALDEDLSRYAVEVMRRRGIDVRLNETVKEIHADHVVLGSGQRLAAHTTIWCAGIAPNPLNATLGLPLDPRGYLRCQPDMRIEGQQNIWAIGDTAVNHGSDGAPYPATAQHATRQGKLLARNIERALQGQPTLPTAIRTQGWIAALGCRTAVARILGVKLSGFPAWFMFRTVYLMKMPGPARKMRVALDWTVGLFFRRDPAQLGVHRKSRK